MYFRKNKRIEITRGFLYIKKLYRLQTYVALTKIIFMKNIFRIVSILEGVSYLLLLFIATPIKYLQDDPSYVKMLGMPHGILFMLYVVLAIVIKKEMNWNNKTLGMVLIASVIPFGTFYVDKKYFKK